MSELVPSPWLRVEASLSELDALLAFVETREEVNEGELRGHLLELYRRVDALRTTIAAADREEGNGARLTAALHRLGQLEHRALGQEDRLLALALDMQSLHRETAGRLALLDQAIAPLRRDVAALQELPGLVRAVGRSVELVHLSVAHLRGDLSQRLDQHDLHFSTMGERQARLETRQEHLEGRMDRLEARMDRVEARMDRLEARMGRLEADMAELKVEVKTLRQDFEDLRVEVRTTAARNHEQVMGLLMKLV
ncbi:MAG: hypothetical protein JNJ54_24360 [Myxococcaceae bacterium]|nr:hypothetical protein [Myxococcaceae bacterium]